MQAIFRPKLYLLTEHISRQMQISKGCEKAVPTAAKAYEKQLMDEINEDREEHGKKPFDGNKPPRKDNK